MLTFTSNSQFVVLSCCGCGMQFGLPADVRDRRKRDHETFYCPAGHSQWYPPGDSDADKVRQLRDQLARERQQHDQHAARLRDEAETLRHSRAALKGQVTRIKNRVGRGVCPCCNRFFENLHRHMTGQHPDYAAATVPPAVSGG